MTDDELFVRHQSFVGSGIRATAPFAWFEPMVDPVLLNFNCTAPSEKPQPTPPNRPAENPTLNPGAMIGIPGMAIPNQMQTSVVGLSGMSGIEMFGYKVATQALIANPEFRVTPQQYLDLQAFGNQVRFVPATSP